MELTAAIKAVESFDEPLLVVTDSRYLTDCFKDRWWVRWESNGWFNNEGEPVKNQDLWRPLIEAYKSGKVEFKWVKAHAGNSGNEEADRLANKAILDAGFHPKNEIGRARVVVHVAGIGKDDSGPGGWAWVVPGGRSDSGAEKETTRNRMELTAAVKAVESLDEPLLVVTDSDYLSSCFGERWWVRWESNNWKTLSRGPVQNKDLLLLLIEAYKSEKVEFECKKDPGNEEADRLANLALRNAWF